MLCVMALNKENISPYCCQVPLDGICDGDLFFGAQSESSPTGVIVWLVHGDKGASSS